MVVCIMEFSDTAKSSQSQDNLSTEIVSLNAFTI